MARRTAGGGSYGRHAAAGELPLLALLAARCARCAPRPSRPPFPAADKAKPVFFTQLLHSFAGRPLPLPLLLLPLPLPLPLLLPPPALDAKPRLVAGFGRSPFLV